MKFVYAMLFGLVALFWTKPAMGASFRVGYSQVDITPYQFETHPIKSSRSTFLKGDKFNDTGVDQKYDFEEASAFGSDQKPGRAEVDDDQNGVIDDCDRTFCAEYLAHGSDDQYDPAGDNYHSSKNPKGTEKDGKYQSLHLGGFAPYYPIIAPNRFAVGVHDPIWSRAIALEDAQGRTLIFVSTDLPGLTWKHINPVRRRIALEFGISTDHIIITSTHNHAAPDAAGYWVTLKKDHNSGFTNRLRLQMEDSIAKAILSMRAAKMKAVTTTHVACMDANSGELKKEADCNLPLIRKGKVVGEKPQVYDKFVMQNDLRDPVQLNTMITALQFVNTESNQTIATLVNWHNHPDSLKDANVLISSDYPHYVRTYVEKYLGGGSVFFTGTLGNQIGLSGTEVPLWDEEMKPVYSGEHRALVKSNNNYDKIRSVGYEIGSEVVAALSNESEWDSNPSVYVKTESVDTQVTNALHQLGTRSVWKSGVESKDKMHWYFPRCFTRFGCVRSDVSVGSIGDVSFVTAPGEVDPAYFYGRDEIKGDFGKKGKLTFGAMPSMREAMGGKHQLFFGQAQNYLSYLIHHTDNVGWWNFGHPIHYEEFVTTDRNFGDDVGNKIMAMLGSKQRYSSRKIYPRGNQSLSSTAIAASQSDAVMDYESVHTESESEVDSLEETQSGTNFILDHFEEALKNRYNR